MIPMIKLQNEKERYRFNLASDTLCSLCKDRAHCAGCAITEIRRSTCQLVEKGIAHMDCCPKETKNRLKKATDLYEKVILLEEIAAI